MASRLSHLQYRLSRIPAGLRRAIDRRRPLVRRLTGTSGRPDFLVIGAQKAGTTSLGAWLASHPGVTMAHNPEIPFAEFHFFDQDRFWSRGLPWYRSHFPRGGVRGEKTPEYMTSPLILDRIHDAFPDVRLVVMLREPGRRAWSAYRHYCRETPVLTPSWDWLVPGGTFEENLDAEEAQGFPRGLIRRGFYADQLQAVFDRFPRGNVFVGIFEHLVADPPSVLDPLADFLGVDRRSADPLPHENVDGRPSPLPPHLAERLRAIFAEPNERLAALLGHDLPGWSGPS